MTVVAIGTPPAHSPNGPVAAGRGGAGVGVTRTPRAVCGLGQEVGTVVWTRNTKRQERTRARLFGRPVDAGGVVQRRLGHRSANALAGGLSARDPGRTPCRIEELLRHISR